MKSMNINENVKFKLNDKGLDILYSDYLNNVIQLEKYYKENYPLELEKNGIGNIARSRLGLFKEPAKDENGYSSTELWDFMRLFGQYLSGSLPFDEDILISERFLDEFDPETNTKSAIDNPEPSYKVLNINEPVAVKLDAKAIKILTVQNNPMPQMDENGYSYFTLGKIMAIFGKHFSIGSDVLFEGTQIVIPDESLKDYNNIRTR